MNHREAVEQMATERYLLDEFAPEDREAFEEHLFDCPECAFDLRVGNAFVHAAKAQLPETVERPIGAGAAALTSKAKPSFWLVWMRPAFVAPAFAALLAVVVFQNSVTFPALRDAATQPRLVQLTHLRPATRGGSHLALTADRTHGVALQLDLPVESGESTAISYSIDLRDAQGKPVWTSSMSAGSGQSDADQQLSLFLPGAKLSSGTYSLDITGLGAKGERNSTEQYVFDIVVTN
ncbi:MAG: anti-sigma factor family protein [Terracidiphilus sp.]